MQGGKPNRTNRRRVNRGIVLADGQRAVEATHMVHEVTWRPRAAGLGWWPPFWWEDSSYLHPICSPGPGKEGTVADACRLTEEVQRARYAVPYTPTHNAVLNITSESSLSYLFGPGFVGTQCTRRQRSTKICRRPMYRGNGSVEAGQSSTPVSLQTCLRNCSTVHFSSTCKHVRRTGRGV